MKPFARRLEKVKSTGLLTTADLATWFGRPYATVRGWLQGYEPWGPNGEESRWLLDALELAIRRKRGFPVPIRFTPIQRRQHVQKARHELNGRLPASRSAR